MLDVETFVDHAQRTGVTVVVRRLRGEKPARKKICGFDAGLEGYHRLHSTTRTG